MGPARIAEHAAELASGATVIRFDRALYHHFEVMAALKADQLEKCCFCESKFLHVAFGDVEHFRPEGGVASDDREAAHSSRLLLARLHLGEPPPLLRDLQSAGEGEPVPTPDAVGARSLRLGFHRCREAGVPRSRCGRPGAAHRLPWRPPLCTRRQLPRAGHHLVARAPSTRASGAPLATARGARTFARRGGSGPRTSIRCRALTSSPAGRKGVGRRPTRRRRVRFDGPLPPLASRSAARRAPGAEVSSPRLHRSGGRKGLRCGVGHGG